jgi:hypothetical protein
VFKKFILFLPCTFLHKILATVGIIYSYNNPATSLAGKQAASLHGNSGPLLSYEKGKISQKSALAKQYWFSFLTLLKNQTCYMYLKTFIIIINTDYYSNCAFWSETPAPPKAWGTRGSSNMHRH